MSEISDPELYSLRNNVYKPLKHFDFPETEQSFKIICFVILGRRMESVAFFVIYLTLKISEILVWKVFTRNLIKRQAAIKTFKKCQKSPTGIYKKSQIPFSSVLDEYIGKKVSSNKVFDSTYKKNIKKARKDIPFVADTVKLRGHQNII